MCKRCSGWSQVPFMRLVERQSNFSLRNKLKEKYTIVNYRDLPPEILLKLTNQVRKPLKRGFNYFFSFPPQFSPLIERWSLLLLYMNEFHSARRQNCSSCENQTKESLDFAYLNTKLHVPLPGVSRFRMFLIEWDMFLAQESRDDFSRGRSFKVY